MIGLLKLLLLNEFNVGGLCGFELDSRVISSGMNENDMTRIAQRIHPYTILVLYLRRRVRVYGLWTRRSTGDAPVAVDVVMPRYSAPHGLPRPVLDLALASNFPNVQAFMFNVLK